MPFWEVIPLGAMADACHGVWHSWCGPMKFRFFDPCGLRVRPFTMTIQCQLHYSFSGDLFEAPYAPALEGTCRIVSDTRVPSRLHATCVVCLTE